ncbi:MAG TPA: exopolysaccharide biosynthesis polyprenyl glycosylphosphotransferase [Kineosporiaceae bacterium]
MSSADDVLFGGSGEPVPAVVDVTDRALAQQRAAARRSPTDPAAAAVPVQAGPPRPGPVGTLAGQPPADRHLAGGADAGGAGRPVAADGFVDVVIDRPAVPARGRGNRAARRRALLAALLAADSVGLAAGWAAAELAPDPRWHAVPPGGGAVLVLGSAVPAWWAALAVAGAYPARHRLVDPAPPARFVNTWVRAVALGLVLTGLARPEAAPGVAVAAPVTLGVGLALRALGESAVRSVFGDAGHRVLVVGSAAATSAVEARLAGAVPPGLRVVGRCAWQREPGGCAAGALGPPAGEPAGGPIADEVLRRRITAAARAAGADLILVADPGALPDGGVRRLAWSLEGTGLGLLLATGLADVGPGRLRMQLAADLPLLAVDEPALTGAGRVLKDVLDRIAAALLLLLLAPLMLLVTAGVAVADPGPALFRQQRVGRHGERFTMLTFRSLRVGADRRRPVLERLDDHLAQGDGIVFTMRGDPRVTTVGRLLRRSSLDELPQLVNVLRGEMSLVGPRPPRPAEVERYGTEALRRLRIKPGMTGLRQVSGRADLDRQESVRLDLSYLENWSVRLDVRILCHTVLAVLGGRGAR